MQTTLARINDQVEARINAVEAGAEPPRVPSMEPVSIVGFAIPEEVLRPRHEEAYTALALKEISAYRKHASELRIKLMEAGIEPLAILPGRAWYSLCDKSGLYLLFPNKHGAVSLESGFIQRFRVDHPTLLDVCVGVVVGLVAAWATYALLSFAGVRDGLYFGTAMAAMFFSFVASAASYNNLKHGRFARNLQDYLASRRWAEVLADLAPKRRIYGGNDWERAKLELPAPPVEVAEVLLRAQRAGFCLYVAAEAGAIQFKGGIEKILGEQYREMLLAEEAARRDPIVFVSHGGQGNNYERNDAVIAVIAQFGDFPIEQEALDAVVGQGVL